MKIERITNNKIKVTLTRYDLLSFDIDVSTMTFTPEKVEEIFKNMIQIAEMEEGFQAYDSQLIIEARPGHQEDCELIMYITRIDPHFPAEEARRSLRGMRVKVRRKADADEKIQMIYAFACFDDVVACARQFAAYQDVSSSLFKLNGSYYLLLSAGLGEAKMLDVVLCEYGKKVRTPNFKAVLRERGDVLIKEGATAALAQYF